MPSSTSKSHSRGAHHRGAHGGGGGGGSQDGGHGGGGGGGGGRLIKVAFARNQAEAEMLQALLLESDVPSVLKRSAGFDNPDFLSAGPHDVMVSEAAAPRAREVLADTLTESEDDERRELEEQRRPASGGGGSDATRLALWIGVAFLGAVILVWLLYQLS